MITDKLFQGYRRLLNQTTPKSLGWTSRDRSTLAEIYGDLKKPMERERARSDAKNTMTPATPAD